MESTTIRKVRACFGEAEKQLFSPIQECLTSLPSVIEVIAVKASYYFVNGFTRNIFTVYTRLNSFLCFTGNLVNVVYSSYSFFRSRI